MSILDTSAIYSTALNAAVLHMAHRTNPRGWDVEMDAPATLDELRHCVAMNGRLTVWSGGSDDTIFGDDEINFAFRAWHDNAHLRAGLPFGTGDVKVDYPAEQAALSIMLADLAKVYGPGRASEWAPILHAEVLGQAQYHCGEGHFPVNQRAFSLAYATQERFRARVQARARLRGCPV